MMFRILSTLFIAFISIFSILSWAQKDDSPTNLLKPTATKPAVVLSSSVWVELTDSSTLPVKKADGTFSSKNEIMMKLLQTNKISKAKLAFSHSKRKSLRNIWELGCLGCNLDDLKKNLQSIPGVKRLASVSPIQAFYEPNDFKITWPSEKPANYPAAGFLGYIQSSSLSADNPDYSLEAIKAQDAWDLTQGSEAIIIGISETGVDDKHPELAKKIAYISPEVMKFGSALFQSNSESMNALKHGTMIGITAAGNTNNKLFKSSIGFKSKLAYYGASYDELLAASYAGIKVINVSWGSCATSKEEQEIQSEVINEVYENGTLIIAAAGNGNIAGLGDGAWGKPLGCNGNSSDYIFPASYKNVFSITGTGKGDAFVDENTTDCDSPLTFSYNDRVDLAAPGLAVPVAYTDVVGKPLVSKAASVSGILPDGFTGHRSVYLKAYGTSLSSALVSGTVGLMLAVNPNLGPASIEFILKKSAANILSAPTKCSNKNFAGKIGAGRLDAYRAVAMAKEFPHLDFAVKAGCKLGQASASVNLVGDSSAAEYRWSNGSTEQVIKNLSAGKYYVSVMDKDERVIDGVATVPAYSAAQMLKACAEAQLASGTASAESATGSKTSILNSGSGVTSSTTTSTKTALESGATSVSSATISSTSTGGTDSTSKSTATQITSAARPATIENKILSIDHQFPNFEDTEEGKLYIKINGGLPDRRDIWNYPPRDNIYRKLKSPDSKKKTSTKNKTTFFKKIFNNLIEEAHADDFVNQTTFPGVVNCRTSTAVTGYFRAYFEDMAVNNGAGNNLGFADNTIVNGSLTRGELRRNAICNVLKNIAQLIGLNNTTAIPDILFPATGSYVMPSQALAGASTYYGYTPHISGLDNGALHYHITSRQNPTPGPGEFDGVIYTNWSGSIPWSVEVPTGTSSYDFETVMTHEILHALGFASRLPNIVSNSQLDVFHNTFVENVYQSSPISSTNGFFNFSQPLSPILNQNITSSFTNNSNVYAGKKNYPNAPFDPEQPIYSPSNFEPGSSLSHFDISRAPVTGTQYMMHPNIGMNTVRQVTQWEKNTLCHLGYEVQGMPECSIASPVANDDFLEIPSTSSLSYCAQFLVNDISPSGTATIYDIQQLTVPSGITFQYFISANCSGTALPASSVTGAKSIKVVSTISPIPSPIALKYRLITTGASSNNRLSEPAMIYMTKCTAPTDEYVCNGDFELGPLPGFNIYIVNNQAFGLNGSPFWETASHTPDLVGKNPAFQSTYYNFPWTNPNSGLSFDMLGNSKFAAVIAFQKTLNMNQFNTYFQNEKLSGKLKTSLTPGVTYTLSLDVIMVGHQGTWPSQYNIQVGLANNSMATPHPIQNLAFNNATYFIDQPVPVNSVGPMQTQWQHVTVNFQPPTNTAYKFLVVGMPYSNNPPASSNLVSYIDNVSIKKANLNSISGIVYNDLNNNGTRDTGEPGISGVPLSLYNSNSPGSPEVSQSSSMGTTQTPYSPTVGGYSFTSLNPLSSGYYYVVVNPENSVSMITEPALNNLFAPYTHPRQVPFINGGHIINQNIGIILPGQSLNPITLTSTTSNTCKANSGAINLTAAGGIPPFTYSWSNGQTTEDISGLASGTYTVTVTDSATPAQTANLSVTVPAYSLLAINGVVTPTIAGGNIDVTATGLAPLNYNWSNGATTEDLTNVPPGTYTVIVTNTNNCTQSATFTIVTQAQNGPCCKIKPNANPLIDCSDPIMNLGNTTVEYGHNRCVQLNGGNSCEWDFTNPACCYPGAPGCGSTNSTTCAPPAVGIPFPFTSLNVTSPAGYQDLYKKCLNESQISGLGQNYVCCVTLPGNLSLTATTKPSCTGKAGAIDLTVSGGTSPYTYSWSNGSTAQDPSNLSPGTYTVTVTSANGLTATLSVGLVSVGPIVIGGSVTPATPASFNNGAINISVTPPVSYSYLWSKAGSSMWSESTEDIANLVPGSYTVNVANKFGCKASKTFKVPKQMKIVAPSEIIKKP